MLSYPSHRGRMRSGNDRHCERSPAWFSPDGAKQSLACQAGDCFGPNNGPRNDESYLALDRLLIPVGLATLLAIAATQIAATWRGFVMFMADQGWYLQAALRMSRGETLYRDVAWAYGPLSAQALAALFRVFGPDAAFASAINAGLLLLAIPLTYAATRALISSRPALLLTAYAALIGAYVGGDLIHWHLHIYTQASVWGFGASLSELVAALRWAGVRRDAWLIPAGLAAAAAALSKPEYGLAAGGSVAAVLIAGRAGGRAWGWWLAACVLPAAAGAIWQASASGWAPLWRGYTGYDQIAAGQPWGVSFPGRELRLLLSSYSAWAAGWLWRRGRQVGRGAITNENRTEHPFTAFRASSERSGDVFPATQSKDAAMRATAPASFDCVRHTTPDSAQDARAGIFRSGWFGWPLLLSLLAVGSVAPDFIGGPRAALDLLRTGDLGQLTFDPVYVLTWLAALPWGPLVPLLLWAGWIGRRRDAPPAWWGLWAFAVLTTLRYVTTGYAFGGAIAPALAVLGWLYTRAPSLRGAAALKQSLASEGIASHTPLAMTPRAEEIASHTPLAMTPRAEGIASHTPLAMTALRLALTLLAVAAIANLAAQATGGSLYFNAPRAWVQTAVGQVAIPAIYARDATAIQTVLR